MRNCLRVSFLFYVVLTFTIARAQDNAYFSHYTPLESVGAIPSDFTRLTIDKINAEKEIQREGLSKIQNIKFVKQIYYGIDQIIRSGRVTYGDSISNYVKKVADKITNGDSTFANMRYYLIQSNVANAFSTDQGIVFITEGMMARLKNEAQLAAILSHELAHYAQRHILKSFVDNIKTNKQTLDYDTRIQRMNLFSQQKELEADKLGLTMYYKAGYPKEEVISTFEVLNYANSPFGNALVPFDYWNNQFCEVPLEYFVEKCPKILSKASPSKEEITSHPSVLIRGGQLLNLMNSFTDWKPKTPDSLNTEFYVIRNIARFETVRNDLFSQHYKSALYDIFLLEREFPNSLYLDRCKAQAWIGLAAFRLNKTYSNLEKNADEIDGESYQIYQFVERLTDEQLAVFALRKVYDIYKKYPEDKEIKATMTYLLKQLAEFDPFYWTNYKEFTSKEAIENYKESHSDKDSLEDFAKSVNENFHFYALSDIKKDTVIQQEYNQLESTYKIIFARKNQLAFNTVRNKHKKPLVKLGLSDFIAIEPTAVQFQKDEVDLEASEKIQRFLIQSVSNSAAEIGLNVHSINSNVLSTIKTDGFNDKSILLRAVYQLSKYDSLALFPVDYSSINSIIEKYKSHKLAFIFLKNTHKPLSIKAIAIGMIVPPIGLTALATGIAKLNSATLSIVVLDLDTFTIDAKETVKFTSKPAASRVDSQLYKLLYQLHQIP